LSLSNIVKSNFSSLILIKIIGGARAMVFNVKCEILEKEQEALLYRYDGKIELKTGPKRVILLQVIAFEMAYIIK